MRPLLHAALLLIVASAPVAAQVPVADAVRREAFVHYRAGQEQLSAERWEAAANEFRAAVALDGLFVDAFYGLGQASMGDRRFASAIQAYTRCLDAARAVHGLRDRDRVAADRRIEEEIRELKDLARRIAASAGPQAAALRVMQVETRIQDLERNRSSNTGAFVPPAAVLLALGSAHFRNGDDVAAERQWTDAVGVNPKLGEAWNNLAVIYLRTGRKTPALDAVKAAERAGFRVHPQLRDDIRRLPGV